MSGPMDLSQLSDAQLQALKGAGGDLTKLPDDMLQGIQASLTPKVDPSSAEAGRAALESSGDPRFVPAPSTTPQTNTWQRLIGQGAQHFNDTVADAALALPDASAWVSRKIGLVPENTPRPSDVAKQGIDYMATAPGRVGDAVATGSTAPLTDSRTSRFEAATPEERLAGDVGGGVGSVFGSLVPLGLINKAVGGAGKIGRVTAAMSSNPGAQVASNVIGNIAGDATGDPRLGMVAALATPAALQGAKRVVNAAPALNTQEAERRALLEFGRQNDLGPLTAGKITDSSKLQTYEGAINRLPIPFLGGRAKATEEAGRDAWQKAILKSAGIQGETAATPDVIDAAKARIGKTFDNLENGTTLRVDPKFGADIAKAKAGFSQQLRSQMPQDILAKLDELDGAASTLNKPGVTGVTIDGTTYKNIRSKLSAQLSSASGTDKQAIGGMINALDAAVERSVPASMAKDWKTARSQWRNLMAIDNAVSSSNNAQTAVGNIPVARFGRESQDNPALARLGQYGNKFVGEKMPYDTASRHAAGGGLGHLLGGGAALFEGMQHAPMTTMAGIGAAAVPFALDAGLNNPLTRALLLRRLANPSQSIAKPGLFGALAGQQAIQNSR